MPVKSFLFEGREQLVSFMETLDVADGVACDVYTFDGDTTKDLGMIRIEPGRKTPLQKVLKGDKTVEGYISGKGKLKITKPNGKQVVYTEPFAITVAVGELMQWEADPDSDLSVYEICYPPYEDGRFQNTEI